MRGGAAFSGGQLVERRAFRVRESTAEQQAQALRSELVELRTALPAERQAAQRKIDALEAELAAAGAALASERRASEEALGRARSEAEAQQADAVRAGAESRSVVARTSRA